MTATGDGPGQGIGESRIVRTPGIRGGKARIDGTRLCVKDVVFVHREGRQIRESYPSLREAQIDAALRYYADHTDEIEAEFLEEAGFFREAESQWQDLLARNGGFPPSRPTPQERAIPRPYWPGMPGGFGGGALGSADDREGRVFVSSDVDMVRLAQSWVLAGRGFRGMITWWQADEHRMGTSDIERAFDGLAGEEEPFRPYPIVRIRPAP